jgi:L-2-hydroxyglutarate oxidase LhgO
MEKISTKVLVVGAGVVGLAIARKLMLEGKETILIEKNKKISEEVSARNSGVIHAGFYYPPASLKSQLCNVGNKMIYQYCKEKNIFAKNTGKIVLGNTDTDLNKINQYISHAEHYKGEALTLIPAEKMKQMEPNVVANFGMLSKETGVLDVHHYSESLAHDFEREGGHLSLNTEFKGMNRKDKKFISEIQTGDEQFQIISDYVVIAVGLNSGNILSNQNFNEDIAGIKKLNFTKGHYFKLKGKSPFAHLIYPMPTKLGLGIHAGFDIDGTVRFGPDTEVVNEVSYNFEPNMKDKFLDAIKRYYPAISDDDIEEDYVGIRPKIQTINEQFSDFSILSFENHKIKNLIFLQGIESPGLTCSLAIGELINNNVIN